jgi:hypothetical protein
VQKLQNDEVDAASGTRMSTLSNLAAGYAALRVLTVVAAFATFAVLPPFAVANQGTGPADQAPKSKEAAERDSAATPPSRTPAADPDGGPPPMDNRELVKRKMELCRQRPELCVQRGEQQDKEGAAERDDPSKNK